MLQSIYVQRTENAFLNIRELKKKGIYSTWFKSSVYLQNHFTYCVKREKEANVFIFSFLRQNITA